MLRGMETVGEPEEIRIPREDDTPLFVPSEAPETEPQEQPEPEPAREDEPVPA
jgi:hypothetical protein